MSGETADEAIILCDEILDDLEQLPERAEDFADSVREKVEDMRDWIERNDHVTDRQMESLQNMHAGVQKWMDR